MEEDNKTASARTIICTLDNADEGETAIPAKAQATIRKPNLTFAAR